MDCSHHWEADAAEEIRDLGLPASGGGTRRSGTRGDMEVNNTEAEHSHAIYCKATNSGPMRAGQSEARSAGVSAVVGAVRNRYGGGEEMGGGVNNEIVDGVGGGVGQGTERGRGRRGGVSGNDRVKWRGMDRGGGRMSNHLDRLLAGNTAGRGKVANT